MNEQPHPNHFGIVAGLFHLTFQEESFDFNVASEIIEDVHSPKEFIISPMKILKPIGKLIITTPYDNRITLSLSIHYNKPTPRNAHLHSFNESKNRKLVSDEVAKLKIEKSTNKHLLKLRV